jgi:hypothetical protein
MKRLVLILAMAVCCLAAPVATQAAPMATTASCRISDAVVDAAIQELALVWGKPAADLHADYAAGRLKIEATDVENTYICSHTSSGTAIITLEDMI